MKTITRNSWLSLLFALVAVLAVASLDSCKGNKDKPKPQFTEFEQGMTSKDSVAVRGLVDQFFSLVEAKDFAGATQMLYRTETNKPDEEPQQLDNDEIQAVTRLLKAVPVESYHIEYIKFSETYNNEVLCTVVIKKSPSKDLPDIKTKMFFKPMRHLGQWRLGLMNSEWGDHGIIDPAKRDSMTKKYADDMQAVKK